MKIFIFLLLVFTQYSCGDNPRLLGDKGGIPDFNPKDFDEKASTEYTATIISGSGAGEYSEGDRVVITPGVIDREVFQSWGGTDGASVLTDPATGEYYFIMPRKDVTIEALFQPEPKYLATIIKGTSGAEDDRYYEGDRVVIAPNQIDRQVFQSWGGTDGASVLTDPATGEYYFIMPRKDVTIEALFQPESTYLATITNGTGGARYYEGQRVVIAPNEIDRQVFQSWGGTDGASVLTDPATGEYYFLMPSSDVTITAIFQPEPKYLATITNGTGGARYYEGQRVVIAPNQIERQVFQSWGGTDGASVLTDPATGEYYFLMPRRDVTIEALFQPEPKYLATIIKGTSGAEDDRYYEGDRVVITPNQIDREVFQSWGGTDGASVLTDPATGEYYFLMPNRNVTIEALFQPEPKYLATINNGSGTGEYYEGQRVVITPNQIDREVFQSWGGTDGASVLTDPATGEYYFLMPRRDVTIEALFQPEPKYLATIIKGTSGAEDDRYYEGDRVVITPNEIERQVFQSWGGTDGASVLTDPATGEYYFLMPSRDVTMEALFQPEPKYLATIIKGTSGAEDDRYYEGDRVVITPEVINGEVFQSWGGTDGILVLIDPATGEYYFLMPNRDVTIEALFQPEPTYLATITNGTGGARYYEGQRVVIAPNQIDGQIFQSWGGTDGILVLTDPATGEYYFLMPNRDVTIAASFLPVEVPVYQATIISGTGGGEYPAGREVDIVPEHIPGKAFHRWVGSHVSLLADPAVKENTFIMPAESIEIEATYLSVLPSVNLAWNQYDYPTWSEGFVGLNNQLHWFLPDVNYVYRYHPHSTTNGLFEVLRASGDQPGFERVNNSVFRTHYRVAKLGQKIYLFGGRLGSTSTINSDLYIYDPAENGSWKILKTNGDKPPYGLANAGMTALNYIPAGEEEAVDHLFVFGGVDNRGIFSNKLYRYDPSSNEWTLLNPKGSATSKRLTDKWDLVNPYNNKIPNGRQQHVVDTIKVEGIDQLILFGGWANNPHRSTTYRNSKSTYLYNPSIGSEGAWTQLNLANLPANSPTNFEGIQLNYSAVSDNKLFIFGGRYGPTPFRLKATDFLHSFDTNDPSDSTIGSWLTNIQDSASCRLRDCKIGEFPARDKCYAATTCLIGQTPETATCKLRDCNDGENPAIDSCHSNICQEETKPTASAARSTIGSLDGKIYIESGELAHNITERSFSTYDPLLKHFQELRPLGDELPAAFANSKGCFNDKYFYFYGGSKSTESSDYLDQFYRFDSEDIRYHKIVSPAAIGKLKDYAIACTDNELFILGGVSETSATSNKVFKFSYQSQAWSELASMIAPLSQSEASVIADKIFLFGGKDDSGSYSNELYVYNLSANTWTNLATSGTKPSVRGKFVFQYYEKANLLYLFGGMGITGEKNDLFVMDPENLTWTEKSLTNPPSTRFGAASAIVNDHIVIFGGVNEDKNIIDLHYLQLETETWINPTLTDNYPRVSGDSAYGVRNNILWTFGGRTVYGGQSSREINKLDLSPK